MDKGKFGADITAIAHQVNFSLKPESFLFSANALRFSSNLDFHKNGSLVLHVKYVEARNGFVLNDTKDGIWGEEKFFEAHQPTNQKGILLTLLQIDNAYHLKFGGGMIVSLGDRFNISGSLPL